MVAHVIFLPVQEISGGKDILIQNMIYSKKGKNNSARDMSHCIYKTDFIS